MWKVLKGYTCAAVPSLRNHGQHGLWWFKIHCAFSSRWAMWTAVLVGSQRLVFFFYFTLLWCLLSQATVLLFSLSCPLVSCLVWLFFPQSDPFGVRMLSIAWSHGGIPVLSSCWLLCWAGRLGSVLPCLGRAMALAFQGELVHVIFRAWQGEKGVNNFYEFHSAHGSFGMHKRWTYCSMKAHWE